MDLSKKKPERIQIDPVKNIDKYENDQLGTLKIKRRWRTMRSEVVDALLDAYKKIQRARKINPKIKAIFKLSQQIRKSKEVAHKKNPSLKEFIDIVSQPYIKAATDYYHLNKLSVEDLEAIKKFVDFIAPLLSKSDEMKDIVTTWQNTLERVLEDYPNTFDDYAKEVVREIMDAIFDYTDELESQEETENISLTTSPFFGSEIEIAVRNNNGDYENM